MGQHLELASLAPPLLRLVLNLLADGWNEPLWKNGAGEVIQRVLEAVKRRFGRKRKPLLLCHREDLAGFEIGRWSYGGLRVLRWNRNGKLQIGSFCSFAENATILLGGEHDTRNVSTYPFGVFIGGVAADAHERTKGDVVIGHDVWVGRDAVILSGVKIGDGAVVGARSVVARDVPPYAIVSGNPARLVRMRFSQEVIEALIATAWWTWPEAKLRSFAPQLLSGDIEAFIRASKD